MNKTTKMILLISGIAAFCLLLFGSVFIMLFLRFTDFITAQNYRDELINGSRSTGRMLTDNQIFTPESQFKVTGIGRQIGKFGGFSLFGGGRLVYSVKGLDKKDYVFCIDNTIMQDDVNLVYRNVNTPAVSLADFDIREIDFVHQKDPNIATGSMSFLLFYDDGFATEKKIKDKDFIDRFVGQLSGVNEVSSESGIAGYANLETLHLVSDKYRGLVWECQLLERNGRRYVFYKSGDGYSSQAMHLYKADDLFDPYVNK